MSKMLMLLLICGGIVAMVLGYITVLVLW